MYLKAGTEKAGSKRAGSKGRRKGERGREISVISGIWFFHALHAFIFLECVLDQLRWRRRERYGENSYFSGLSVAKMLNYVDKIISQINSGTFQNCFCPGSDCMPPFPSSALHTGKGQPR